MKHALNFIKFYLIALPLLVLAFVAVMMFKGCQTEPQQALQMPESLPVEQNFQVEKIWTEADFKQAEVEPYEVDYLNQRENFSGWLPDNLTEEDKRLITQHTQQRLQHFTAGATK